MKGYSTLQSIHVSKCQRHGIITVIKNKVSCARRQGCKAGRWATATPVGQHQCQGDGDRTGGSGVRSRWKGENAADMKGEI